MNNQVNHDLQNVNNWICANKICLNVSKTEVVQVTKKQMWCDVKLNLNGKRLYPKISEEYLGIKIDKKLTWRYQLLLTWRYKQCSC